VTFFEPQRAQSFYTESHGEFSVLFVSSSFVYFVVSLLFNKVQGNTVSKLL